MCPIIIVVVNDGYVYAGTRLVETFLPSIHSSPPKISLGLFILSFFFYISLHIHLYVYTYEDRLEVKKKHTCPREGATIVPAGENPNNYIRPK